MSVGTPPLRTRTAGTRELIIENVTGRSVPIEHAAFVKAAADFLSDIPALRRMGAAGSKHVRANFTYDKQLSATLELYREIAGASRKEV
jgi:glycosyltransferase involved in cell wall biosynthesis